MNIEHNIAIVLAHSLLLEAKGPEPIDEIWAVNGGDPPAPATQESMDQILRAYTANMPAMIDAQAEAARRYEPQMMNLREQISPRQNQLDLELLQRFGPQFARVNQSIAGQNAMDQARNDLAVVTGPGRDLVREAMVTQREADPEAYRARELAVEQLGRLNDSLINPDAGLSGSERTEIDRSLARDNFSRVH